MKAGALRRLSVNRLALALACLAPLALAPCVAADPDPIPADFPAAPGLLKSADGATWVVGGDSLDRMLLLDWVEDVSTRVERLTGLPRTRQGRGLGVVLMDDDPAALPAVESLQYLVDGRLEQRLRLTHGSVFPRDTLETELCRLLGWGYVVDHAAGAAPRDALGVWVAETVPAGVPDALALGMRGALTPETRAAASDLLYREWTRGRLPPLATYLRAAGACAVGPPEPGLRMEEAYAIMLVNWITTAPTRAERWACVFARLASGGGLGPDVLIECLSGEGARVADLEERWDAWILAQPRRILAPGVTRPMDWALLRAELEIPRGQQGLPNDPDLPPRLALEALAAYRGAAWMPRVAQAKALRLRTLALGRGEDLHAVVDPLCEYLDLLTRGARPRRLQAAWAAAAAALDVWDAQGEPAYPSGHPYD